MSTTPEVTLLSDGDDATHTATTSRSREVGSFWNEGLILGFASAASYALAFAYEGGYCSYYNIPLSLISVNLTTTLVAAAAGVSVFIVGQLQLFTLLFRVRLPSSDIETDRLVSRLITLLPFVAYGIATGVNLVVVIGGGLAALYAMSRSREDARRANVASVALLNSLTPKSRLALVASCYILLAAFALGRSNARGEPQYLLYKDDTNYIVLRIYGDTIIVEPYVETIGHVHNLIIGGGLRFFKVGDRDTPAFRLRAVYQQLSLNHYSENAWNDWLYPYH